MTEEARRRLSQESLLDRIKSAAYNVAMQWNADPEDVVQEIVLAILEEYTKDPDFLNQTDAYIVNKGAWMARNALKRMAVQEWNHEVEDVETETGTPLLDLVGEYNPWAAVDLGLALNTAYDELGEVDRGIVAGMYEGLNRREIGQKVGLSHTAVNNHIPAIAEAIRAHL
jgi:DNA-directed RNA polymerase specialized sigma24 family protein